MADKIEAQSDAVLVQAQKDLPGIAIPGVLAAEISKRAKAFREKFK